MLSCQSGYGLAADRQMLVLDAAGLGLLMAAIRALPRFRWAALLLAAEGCALSVWLLWDRLLPGAAAAAAGVAAALGGGTGAALSGADSTFFLCAALALLAFPLGWAALWLRSAWAAAAMTGALLVPVFLANRLPRWPDFLLLLVCWCALLLVRTLPRGDRAARARLTLAALPAAGCALVLLTLALPQERYVYPMWAREVNGVLLSGDLAFSLPDLVRGGIRVGGSGSRVDLASAGPLSLSQRTMLRVETEVPGRIYLRGRSAGTYTGTAWEPLGEEVYRELGELGGYEPLNFPALTGGRKDWYAVTVESAGTPGGCFYVPYFLLTNAEELSGGAFADDSHIARNLGTRRYTLYYRPEAGPDFAMRPLEGEAAQAEEAYRAFVYEHYLEVPRAAQEALVTWTWESASRYDLETSKDYREAVQRTYWTQLEMVELIRTYLAATTTYDTNAPAMPEGADFLDYFLNESRRGYCMHYATATTLFLRMMGIPARYASGYAVTVPDSGRVDVPESSAHAWVEIYLDGYGWYPVEVTPAFDGAAEGAQAPEETVRPTATPGAGPVEPSPSVPLPGPSQAPEAGVDGVAEKGDGAAEPGGLVWAAGLPALWLLLLVRRRLAALVRRRRLWGGSANAAVLWAYRLQRRLLPWGGRARPEVEELALKARFSQHTLTEDERGCAARAVEEERKRVDAALPLWRRLAFRWLFALR